MNSRSLWSRILVVIGSIGMVVGIVDPMEGSLIILPGSGLVLLGAAIDTGAGRRLGYWATVFVLIAVGVGTLFGVSAIGGFGGRTGRSMWWALTLLPYPIGWLMGIAGIVRNVVALFKARREPVAG